jgi:hypothetical protein
VAHWIKITKQLADDAPLLAAYINARMIYGVNRKVETQLAVGDGVDPNISGLFDTGNFTPHGIANAALGTTLKAYVLFRKVMAALEIQGYTPSAILLNPLDVANLDVEIMTSQTLQGASIVNAIRSLIRTSVGVAQDTFLIGDFGQAATLWDREAVNIAMSREDGTNFTTNLITILAERRLALTVEVPAAIIGGDLTPA